MVSDLSALRPSSFAFHAAIFDFDGTLADSHGIWNRVDQIFFSRRGLLPDSDYAERLSTLGFEDGARYTIEHFHLTDSVESVCDEWNALGSELYASDVSFFTGALDYLSTLSSLGIPMALATTNDPRVLSALPLSDFLCSALPVQVFGCQVAHHTKEFPDIYLEASRQLGVYPSECIVFEDLLSGIRTAHNAFFQTAVFLNGSERQDIPLLLRSSDYSFSSWLNLLD